MKHILTLITGIVLYLSAQAQVLLNEIYPIPGNNRQEFFELYNNDIFSTPVPMDGYTLITYYEDNNNTRGFYVMDLPDTTLAPRGYFVGSAAKPFNYQGITNSPSSYFSWNDLSYMSLHNAYVKKWQMATTVPAVTDGNADYDLVPITGDLDDFFQKLGGGGATYVVFLYHDGILRNTFLGGVGGAIAMPSFITSMPDLYVDMAGTATDFTVKFSNYASVPFEYVTQDVGTDNGFIRTSDGYCGTWTKSSNGVNHTPGITNGGDTAIIGDIKVQAAIHRGDALAGSEINYDVVAAPLTAFPVTIQIYVDNGTMPGLIDAGDTFVESQVENTLSDGPFSTRFYPYNANVIVVINSNAGCIDNIRYIPNAGVLPVQLGSFASSATEEDLQLRWSVEQNELVQSFLLEQSNDGRNYTSVTVIWPTGSAGMGNYSVKQPRGTSDVFYRLKVVEQTGRQFYSPVLFIDNSPEEKRTIRLYQNPVESYLSFAFSHTEDALATVRIYNLSGTQVFSQKVNVHKGANQLSFNMDGRIYKGLYILEVQAGANSSRAKLLKN